jgi:RES domain-containing protein
VLVWRISAKRYTKFDGAGARLAGGRWNSPGSAVVYTSATVSLAALELYVHLNPSRAVKDLVLTSAQLPDDLKMQHVNVPGLPSGWRDHPAPEALQRIGDEWIVRNVSAVLVVPSAVIPQENNYLLNPLHPEFKHIRINKPEPFSFDLRIGK